MGEGTPEEHQGVWRPQKLSPLLEEEEEVKKVEVEEEEEKWQKGVEWEVWQEGKVGGRR